MEALTKERQRSDALERELQAVKLREKSMQQVSRFKLITTRFYVCKMLSAISIHFGVSK